MGQLNATIRFRCEQVRESRGEIVQITFQKRAGNGKGVQDELAHFNLMRDRGVPEVGQEYEITIKPATKRLSER